MTAAAELEGVTKFEVEHQRQRLESGRFAPLAAEIGAWRRLMAEVGMLGQDPARYGGAGFGNASARVGAPASGLGRRAMLITGTQTGARPWLGLDDFCVVDRYDIDGNRVVSRGLVPPSSEAMTHGAIYDLGPHVRAVLHGHAPIIWRRARSLGIPETRADVAYGTPEMAREVTRLYRESALAERELFAMAGHEDGVIAFGRSLDEAGRGLMAALAAAYRLGPP